MLKNTLGLSLAAGLVALAASAAPQSVEAGRGGRGGVIAGFAAGALVGSAVAGYPYGYARPYYYGQPYYYRPYAYTSGPSCYYGPRQCDVVGQRCWENRFGEPVCRGGEYRCWRPRLCD